MDQDMKIEGCDLNIKSNNSSHRTDQCPDQRLIVRRGQPFTVSLLLAPAGDVGSPGGNLTFIVEAGPLPRKESDTRVVFGLSESTSETQWSSSRVADESESDRRISVSISSSPDAPIGVYNLSVDQDGQETHLGQFTLLFNAWCPHDAVFMRSERKRQEYVLSQHGQIFRGTWKRIKGIPWNFGQFESGILDICLKILDQNPKFISDADQDCSARRNPVYVTRVLSAMINSNDDSGVIVGSWSDYEGGVHPGTWIGSGDILRQWSESGPVHYGQCWVFAAVGCAVSRALGIPCRVVTNFGSAHDTDANLVIENLYDEDGDRISDDSVWNFHVWVDSWMTRPDLGDEYTGWQTSDPTPQETSEGIFCCGPAPLRAIKEGELTRKYDAPFIFAEVNADVVDKVQLSTGEFVQFSGSTKSVGRFISTKAVGSDQRHDITHQYKYPEGSEEERRVYEKATHHNKLQKEGVEPGLHLKIKLADNMAVGSDFEVHALLTNNCMEARTCTLLFFARSGTYNGRQGESVGFSSDQVEVPPGEERRLNLDLQYDSYGSVITSDRLILLSVIAIDKQTIAYHKAEKTIVLDEPTIDIELEGEVRVNQLTTVQVSLVNPLPETLEDCSFTLGGAGLTGGGAPLTLKLDAVGPGQEARVSTGLTPLMPGATVLLVSFDSDHLKNIKSSVNIVVME